MDPVDFLTVIVEASVGLLGFTGVVVTFGRGSESAWSARERFRLANLLGWGAIALASALLSLALLSAELQPPMLWRISSLGWLVLATPFTIWVTRWRYPAWRDSMPRTGFPWVYFIASVLAFTIVALLQLVNAALWNSFWPHFSALAATFGLGAIQFVRLVWYKLFG